MARHEGLSAPRRDEAAVQARSAELRKELSIADLAFAQLLFIVGLQWVGVAAKQGPSHVIFWLIAIVFFYVPSAIVAVWLNRAMPLEGGLYQWAKLGFNERFGFVVAWNLWLFAILNMTNVGLQLTQYLGYIFGPGVAEFMAQNWVISAAAALIITRWAMCSSWERAATGKRRLSASITGTDPLSPPSTRIWIAGRPLLMGRSPTSWR